MDRSTILFLGTAQAAFLVALIASKKGKTLPDGVLASWLLVLGVHHLLYGLHSRGIALPASLLNLNPGVSLLQGPFLFLYVDTLTSGRRRFRLFDALHFVPFFAFAAFVTFFLDYLASSSSTLSVFRLSGWITAAILVSVPAYSIVAFSRLREHEARVLKSYSEPRGRDLQWLRRIVLALLAVWTVVILAILAPAWLPSGYGHQIMTAVTFFIYAIGYFGWRQFAPIEASELAAPRDSKGETRDSVAKYDRSGLGASEIEDLIARLKVHLEEDGPYLEPGVTLKDIAANLETTPNHLSQAINQGLEKNFYELINERRVEEFKRRSLDPRNRHRTLLAVAFDSGFSSKSSFNRVFKKLVAMSPRQYVESHRDRENLAER